MRLPARGVEGCMRGSFVSVVGPYRSAGASSRNFLLEIPLGDSFTTAFWGGALWGVLRVVCVGAL